MEYSSNSLRKNKHHSRKLQRHYNKYKEQDLEFKLITTCDLVDLLSIEQFYIDSFAPYFNECPIAGSRLGYKISDESKERISKSQIGRIPWNKGLTKETSSIIMDGIRLLSESHKGQVAWNKGLTKEADERVKKYSESNTGQVRSDETRQRISKSHIGQIAWNKGIKHGI